MNVYLKFSTVMKYPKPYKFIPRNPSKYVGDSSDIWIRSSWEKKLMIFFDTNSSILKWNSECTRIPYVSPLDSRIHMYHVDFSVMFRTREGQVRKALVEVKPMSQVLPPKKQVRNTKRYLAETATYLVNQAKWKAAMAFCEKNGWEWQIITEKELGFA